MKKGESPPPRGSSRPVSWCIGANSRVPLALREPRDPQDARTEGQGRGLARSTSYQALHSALARLYRIDDFNMERIGAGFFSEVFKVRCPGVGNGPQLVHVRHRVTGDVMVLKMNKLLSNRHNMLREVELMNRLHHPNILSYYGVCVNEGQVHALTEYINGGSLDALIGNQAINLSWATRVSFALDIARGMTYLHSRGVFHRDLTSKNVLIKHTTEGGEHKMTAVIADFGLAAPIPRDKCVRLRQVGSPYWMAPEVIRGDWYDHHVDIFSFGIIVCELIARCEADPDILPRTHNFGIHYLDFYSMIQPDCPSAFLQMAFQCCQIEPTTRPSFEELTGKLESLLHQLTPPPSRHAPRKLKVCHRRSLSDDTFKVLRHQLGEGSCVSGHHGGGSGVGGATLTPQEIAEKMSAADPYFQASSSTVNPFSRIKLPARSQLALQEGGRYCHSLPDYLVLLPDQSSIGSSRHIHTSDSCLCHASPASCQCRTHRQFSAQVEGGGKQCQCVGGNKHTRVGEREGGDCRCRLDPGCGETGAGTWQQNGCQVGREGGSATSIPRSDPGSGGGEGGAGPGPVRRRGSGESGFFSVGDVERPSTPDLCLSYSELSTASLVSTEDEDPGRHRPAQRSSSVVTDSSEDLSSLGCCHDHHTPCDLTAYSEGDDTPVSSRLSEYDVEVDTDIRQIVDFFERNIGWSGSGGGSGSSSRVQQGTVVPLLTHKFSALNTTHRPPFLPCPFHPKSFAAKEHPRMRPPCTRRDTFRVKDRPKVYITEGTVRAKRDIFEPK